MLHYLHIEPCTFGCCCSTEIKHLLKPVVMNEVEAAINWLNSSTQKIRHSSSTQKKIIPQISLDQF